jgi:protein ImuB
MSGKRIAAIVLPDIACELVRARGLSDAARPFAVIIDDDGSVPQSDQRAILDAVDANAWRYGVRPGQRAAQACGYVSGLRIVHLSKQEVLSALGSVAEIALGFGTTAAIALECGLQVHVPARQSFSRAGFGLGAGAGPFDSVWLDVSGCARLTGGEDVLCAELTERVRELGHRARVAIAGGPRIAQALARWKVGRPDDLIVSSTPAEAAARLGELPVAALPLDSETLGWLGKLGIFRIEDLARLDRARLAHRLSSFSRRDRPVDAGQSSSARRAGDVLELCQGRDAMPLSAYAPPRCIVERADFEQALDGREPLLFVLRRLCARATSRLDARGEACSRVTLVLSHDRGVVALENRTSPLPFADETRFEITLPVPLSQEQELVRTLAAKLERLTLPAPITAVELRLDDLGARIHSQLTIGRRASESDPNALPILLAELGAWIGPDRVGVLHLDDSLRPEARSRLVSLSLGGKPTPLGVTEYRGYLGLEYLGLEYLGLEYLGLGTLSEPTRLLPRPVAVTAVERGALVGIGTRMDQSPSGPHPLFVVDRLRLSTRIDGVEWWTSSPVCRDYARACLRSGIESAGHKAELTEAWLFVDRTTRRGFLHGWFD